ncbi:hypothetical protein EV174_006503 [Coemansia sp. RSA 2320]|nr:hypothetical protein EV174_006503 [Coemansia sp. RSA 2320]
MASQDMRCVSIASRSEYKKLLNKRGSHVVLVSKKAAELELAAAIVFQILDKRFDIVTVDLTASNFDPAEYSPHDVQLEPLGATEIDTDSNK